MKKRPNFLGCLISASGATLLAFAFSLVSISGVFFAFVKLLGLPDIVLWVLLALGLIPAGWVTIWTALRAWHVENRLELGLDIDEPEFSLRVFLRKSAD